LPGGGWPHPALIEVLNDRAGIGELGLLLPALRHLSEDPSTTIAWFNPPHLPYPPALAEHGLAHARQLVSRPLAGPKALWAMEQALRSGACAAVLAWTEAADTHALRRLKLAAIEGGCLGFLFRSQRYLARPSPATVRLALRSEGATLVVELVKVQGGQAATLRLSSN
jgi:cell division inhibitor SulA/protein ImuA